MKSQLPEDQANLLKSIEEFNRSIGQKGWNLNHVIIENQDISDIILMNSVWDSVDVNDSRFVLSHIKGSTFSQVSFRDVDFSNSEFNNCTFRNCTFTGVKFSEAKFFTCTVERCTFELVDFNGTLHQGNEWQDVKANQMDCKYAKFDNVTFLAGEYTNTKFSQSLLNDVKFLDSKFSQCGFVEAELNRCQYKIDGQVVSYLDAQCDQLTIIGAPTVNDLNLAGITGRDIRVENLSHSKFLSLDFAEIHNLELRNSRLLYASCVSASIMNSTFHETTFECIRFNKTSFQNTNFENIVFVDELIFDDALFKDVKFSNISKAENYSGSFKNTIFEGKPPF